MKVNKERQGEVFIFLEAMLWSLFPIITILSYHTLPPLLSLGESTLFASIFFAAVLSVRKKWKEIANTSALKDILFATFFTGILYYIFSFFGLQYTSAGNASIVALIEVFFSYVFFHLWRKDHLPFIHLIGALCMVAGALIVLSPSLKAFQVGDMLILTAAFFAPFGNFFQRRARTKVSSESIMFIRSIVSSGIIFFLAFFFHEKLSLSNFRESIFVVIINGFFLLGLSKVLWVEGIHRISVVKANSLASISPLLTLLFAWLLLKNTPTLWQFLSFLPMFSGILLLSRSPRHQKPAIEEKED